MWLPRTLATHSHALGNHWTPSLGLNSSNLSHFSQLSTQSRYGSCQFPPLTVNTRLPPVQVDLWGLVSRVASSSIRLTPAGHLKFSCNFSLCVSSVRAVLQVTNRAWMSLASGLLRLCQPSLKAGKGCPPTHSLGWQTFPDSA